MGTNKRTHIHLEDCSPIQRWWMSLKMKNDEYQGTMFGFFMEVQNSLIDGSFSRDNITKLVREVRKTMGCEV